VPEVDRNGFATIMLERCGASAWLTLNRPNALNATNETMHAELLHALADVGADPQVKALLITGAGEKAFCIGSDLAFLDEAFGSRNFGLFREYLERLNRVFFTLEELPIPTIALVNGRARAGGFELILACDIAIVAEEALIGDVHTPYGHMPGGGATQRAARRVGLQRALELIYTGRWLTGSEAVEWGLALKAVPRAALRSEGEALVKRLAAPTRESLGFIKHAAYAGWDLPLRDGVALEIESYLRYLETCPAPIELYFANQRRERGSSGTAVTARAAPPPTRDERGSAA
jgi:enoyl-CoA hydratase/carnithine racemase